MKVALLADTHVPDQAPDLPPGLLPRLRGVDLILHAGDMISISVLEALRGVAETVAVSGNMDRPEVYGSVPSKQTLILVGHTVGLIHGDRPPEIQRRYLRPRFDSESPAAEVFYQYLADEFPEADVVVFGHFHMPVVKRWRGRLLVNPGPTASRHGRRYFGMLELGPGEPQVEIHEL
jgi:uncharacterized protein